MLKPRWHSLVVRLADEGVPVRSICRATGYEFGDVWGVINEAMNDGTLVELPANDWPANGPGARRAERLRTWRPNGMNPKALVAPLMTSYALTPMEAMAVALLVLRGTVTRAALHGALSPVGADPETDPKIIDVVIHKVRKKLSAHGVEVKTLHGLGHQLEGESRDKVRQRLFGPEPDPAQDNARGV